MSITVQHVPAGHPYPRAIRPLDAQAAPDVVFWPDPPVPGAPAHQWWPPQALDPEWIAEHRPNVLHVHFGFEHLTPEQIDEVVKAQHAHGGAVAVTVHDLENPHLTDQAPHRARLAVLLDAADAVFTLTPGAAAAVAQRYGVRALVVPHPHIVPLDALREAQDAAAGRADERRSGNGAADAGATAAEEARERGVLPGVGRPARVLVHAKDLRAQVDPVGMLPVLAEAVGLLRERGLAVEITVDVQDSVQDEEALAQLAAGVRQHGFVLWQHPRLSDEELHVVLRQADVSVLPYRTGTHSGWVEMCRDLGVPVAVADIGHIAGQAGAWTEPDALAAFDPVDAGDLADALESLLRTAPGLRAVSVEARTGQRRRVAAAHIAAYRDALAGRSGTRAAVSVLVITGNRDAHLTRVIAGLGRSARRPDQVVVVFMGQPDGEVPATDLPVTVGHVQADHGLPLAAARNRAAELATGDVLVFLDVDCIPSADAVGTLAAEVGAHPGSLVMGTPRYLGPGWVEALAADGVAVDPGTAGREAGREARREARREAGRAAGRQPTDGDLRRLSVTHRARTALIPGPSEAWHLVWTLVMAIGREDLARAGGFDEGFTGYGAEDTDLAFRARDAGLELRISPTEVFHQHHGVHRPPLNHLADILVNALRFRELHGSWAMEGWLRAFADAGLVDWDPDGDHLELLREPTAEELAATRDDQAAY